MPLIIAALTFISGLGIGVLLMAYRRHLELEQLKSQARDYRLQAVALKDLCRRLERVSQLQPLALPRHFGQDYPDHFSGQEFSGPAQEAINGY